MVKALRLAMLSGLLVLLLVGGPGHAQSGQGQTTAASAQPQNQPPVFRAGINFVRVDVIVLDRSGNPVNNLKPEDFEIVEQNAPQKIETFKLISLDGGLTPGPDGPAREIRTDLDEETEAARDDVRLFAIFLDDYHVRRETGISARDQVARFVETQLGPSDMVGLMYPLESVDAIRMTRNHEAIAAGVRRFVGRKYDYTATNDIERRYAYYPAQTVETIRNEVSWSALRSLITHMGGLKEGRKALILVSEGYSSTLPPQMQSAVAGFPGLGNPAANDPNAADDPLVQRAIDRGRLAIEDDMRELYNTANQYNVAIYAVDPRGLSAGEFGLDQNIGQRTDRQYLDASLDTLRTLAVETDGRAIINRNDLTIGMKQIVRDTSAYYLLGYNSTFTATDGKFHEIKVRVKRPGVQVRARKGYWAFTAQDAARATAAPAAPIPQAYTAALSAISQPAARARIVRTWIGSDRGSDGKTRVTFVWEPMPRPTGDRSRGDEVPARVSLTAATSDGAPFFRGRVPEAGIVATGPSVVTFEARPGPLQLRVAVESAAAEVLDSEVREIVVPDLNVPQTTIATPVLFRARTVREFQQLKTDPKAAPTAARDFARTDRVFLRVAAYGAATQPPTVTAQLLNRTGQPITTLTPVPGSGSVVDIDLSLAVLPVGEYLIEVTATATGAPVKEVVGFRIAS